MQQSHVSYSTSLCKWRRQLEFLHSSSLNFALVHRVNIYWLWLFVALFSNSSKCYSWLLSRRHGDAGSELPPLVNNCLSVHCSFFTKPCFHASLPKWAAVQFVAVFLSLLLSACLSCHCHSVIEQLHWLHVCNDFQTALSTESWNQNMNFFHLGCEQVASVRRSICRSGENPVSFKF